MNEPRKKEKKKALAKIKRELYELRKKNDRRWASLDRLLRSVEHDARALESLAKHLNEIGDSKTPKPPNPYPEPISNLVIDWKSPKSAIVTIGNRKITSLPRMETLLLDILRKAPPVRVFLSKYERFEHLASWMDLEDVCHELQSQTKKASRPSRHSVTNLIFKLRKKLEGHGLDRNLVETRTNQVRLRIIRRDHG